MVSSVDWVTKQQADVFGGDLACRRDDPLGNRLRMSQHPGVTQLT
jgi:hypothetical protein